MPKPPLVVDLTNGPKPVSCDVIEIEGIKTFKIDFVVTCTTNEVQQTNVGPITSQQGHDSTTRVGSRSTYRVSPLLCHEWEMSHDVDQDFWTTRTITGRAVFRQDIMRANGLIPDQLRYWIGHPVPPGFSRQSVKVSQLPDGLTLAYSVVDRQRSYTPDPNVVTRVEIVYTRATTNGGLEQNINWARNWGPVGWTLLIGAGILGIINQIEGFWGGTKKPAGKVKPSMTVYSLAFRLPIIKLPFASGVIPRRICASWTGKPSG